jgi:hypothetical protein
MTLASFEELYSDVITAVEEAVATNRIVNVSAIAETLRRRHERLNIALEDVELLVLQCTDRRLPVEFDGAQTGVDF